jgi:arsenate reductase-like glutaredoxin family protein
MTFTVVLLHRHIQLTNPLVVKLSFDRRVISFQICLTLILAHEIFSKMPTTFPFKASDESVNSFGYWVLTAGIEIPSTGFVPVYYNHETDKLPIGKAYNFKKDANGNLTCDIELDEQDSFAMQVKSKLEGNYITACSMGIIVLATSKEAKFLKPNQTKETVVACRLVELSIAPIPSNANAIKLCGENGSDYQLRDLPKNTDTEMNLKDILTTKGIDLTSLGLKDDATEEQIADAIKKLSDTTKTQAPVQNIDVKALVKEKGVSLAQLGLKDDAKDTDIIAAIQKLADDDGEAKSPTLAEKLANKVLAIGKLAGVVTNDNEAIFKKLALQDVETTSELIEKLAAVQAEQKTQKPVKVEKSKLSELAELLKMQNLKATNDDGNTTAKPTTFSQRVLQKSLAHPKK